MIDSRFCLKAFIFVCFSFALIESSELSVIKPSKKKPSPSKPTIEPLSKTKEPEFITSEYCGGRLGNQLFQVAAALSLGLDQNAIVVFPDYAERKIYDLPENLKHIFFRLNTNKALRSSLTYIEDPSFSYAPIPYTPNMHIRGFYQSEKYFKHNKDKILALFEPKKELLDYLNKKYNLLISHPYTVGVHLRAYALEDLSILKAMVPIGLEYYDKAASLFDDEALFVIFSDNISYAKKLFETFDRPHYIVEGETQYADLFLMSLMKHQIISNSTFSWWAAYLNKNPYKVVIAPRPWFQPIWQNAKGNDHIIPSGWHTINPLTLEISDPK